METKTRVYNHDQQKWDNYKAFHNNVGYGKFVLFQTGELMTCKTNWNPDDRRIYGSLDVAVTYPDDNDFRFMLPDGTPVPKAWLTQNGNDAYFIDLRTKHAVSLRWVHSKKNNDLYSGQDVELPKHMESAVAWIMSENTTPKSRSKIQVSSPNKPSRDERSFADELVRICTVYAQVNQNQRVWNLSTYNVIKKDAYLLTPSEVFGKMDDHMRFSIAKYGVHPGRSVQMYDYLLAEPR